RAGIAERPGGAIAGVVRCRRQRPVRSHRKTPVSIRGAVTAMFTLPWSHRLGVGIAALAFVLVVAADEGTWTDLLNDEKLEAWKNPSTEWIIAGDAGLDAKNPRRLEAKPGKGVVVNGPKGRIPNLITKANYRDVEVHLEFLIPKGSNSGLKFEGLYEIQIRDTADEKELSGDSCGGIYP